MEPQSGTPTPATDSVRTTKPVARHAVARKSKAKGPSLADLRRQIDDLKKENAGLVINLNAKARTTEVNSSEIRIEQPPTLQMPGFNEPLPAKPSSIQSVDSPLSKTYLKALAFAEDPVTIMLTPSTERNAPTWKECSVNGLGIEVLVNGQWQEWKAIPIGKQVVTKRKYVEVLLRAKQDNVMTEIVQHRHHEDNNVRHNVVMTTQITHIWDPSGIERGTLGGEWFHRLVAVPN